MMNEQTLENNLMEVRENFMLSPAGDSEPTFRTAHFLKPISNTIDEPSFELNPSFSSFEFEPKEWPLKMHCNGWRQPQEKWVCWVDELKQKYESVWKKAGIFEAIMSTKCKILRNKNLLFGVVEKWCCETNTFVFSFGEATITLEDVMVLGGYPILGEPVFAEIKDQEMKEVKKKLILARQEPWKTRKSKASTSKWMDIFINKGSEIEHEAFLAAWLSIFVFPHKINLVKSSLFHIAIHLAGGNQFALAPAVLASLYKDLSLFKETIVGLKKCSLGGDRIPMEVTLQSPFYLVQIWVWERFKNLQPQPQSMLINHGDPLLFRWHMVKDLNIDNVRLALDLAMDDFLWRPYVIYGDKCGMFYPNDEIWIPFKKDLDKEILSFVTCLRVCELVGFGSTEQYLPHRVAMQFGMDQDVPAHVPRSNWTKAVAWENYCRPFSDRNLYFPSRFFEADVTDRYAKWWKQSVLGCDDFVKNIVRRKRSASSRKHRPHGGKANKSGNFFLQRKSGNDPDVPPGFPPKLVDTLTFGKFCVDDSKSKTRKADDFYANVHSKNFVHNGLKAVENIDVDEDSKPLLEEYKCGCTSNKCKHLFNQCCSASSADYVDFKKILPMKRPVPKENNEPSIGGLEKIVKDANGSKEVTQDTIRNNVSLSNKVTVVQDDVRFRSDMAAQAEANEAIEERERKEREEKDDEVVVLLKEKYLKNQEEIERLTRQQEEILRYMDLREKRDDELKQLLASVLKNEQPQSCS